MCIFEALTCFKRCEKGVQTVCVSSVGVSQSVSDYTRASFPHFFEHDECQEVKNGFVPLRQRVQVPEMTTRLIVAFAV